MNRWTFTLPSARSLLKSLPPIALANPLVVLISPGFRHQLLLNIAIQIQNLWVWKWFPLLPVVLMNLPDFIILRLDPTLRANLDLRDMLTKQIDNFVDHEDDLNDAHEVIYHHLLHPSSEKPHTSHPRVLSLMR